MDKNVNRNASTIGAAQDFRNQTTQLSAPKVQDDLRTEFKSSFLNDKESQDSLVKANLDFASGVVYDQPFTPAPMPEQPEIVTTISDYPSNYNADLYSSNIGITQYSSLRNKVGLRADESFTQYYRNNNGFVPEGFEKEAKLLLHEEKIKSYEQEFKEGKISQTDFLYKAYGKDLMKRDNYDLTNPNYWYSKLSNNDMSDIFDDYNYMSQLYARSMALYQQEAWFRDSNVPAQQTLLGYVGKELKLDDVRNLFGEQFEQIDKLVGDGQRALDLWRAGMLDDSFLPVIDSNGDGKADFYMHYDGRLYKMLDNGTPGAGQGYNAAVFYDEQGNIEKIRVRNANGVGETFTSAFRGAGDFITGIVEFPLLLGALGWDLIEGAFGLEQTLDKTRDLQVWTSKVKNSWSWYSSDYITNRGIFNKNGEIEWQNVANGTAAGISMIAGILLTGGLGGATKASATLASSKVGKLVATFGDDIVNKLTQETVEAGVTKAVRAAAYNTVDDVVKAMASLPDQYLIDDIANAATKLIQKSNPGKAVADVTADQVMSAITRNGLDDVLKIGVVRSNAKLAYDTGRGILLKGWDGAVWGIRSLTAIRNGSPTASLMNKAVSAQLLTAQSLVPLFLRDFATTSANLKARQSMNNLTEGDIVLHSLISSATNFGISMLLRGTVNQAVLDRHSQWLESSLRKNLKAGETIQQAIANAKLRGGLLNFINKFKLNNPIGFGNVNSIMDVAENALTMAMSITTESMYRDEGGVLQGGNAADFAKHLGGLFNNPQFLVSNLYMHLTNMNGNIFNKLLGANEVGMKTGEVYNAIGSIEKVVQDSIQDVRKLIYLENNKGTDEGKRNAVVLQKQITEINNLITKPLPEDKPENWNLLVGYLRAAEKLDELSLRADAITGEETSLIREKIKKNVDDNRKHFIRSQVQAAADQYNALKEVHAKVFKDNFNGNNTKKIRNFFKSMFYGQGAMEGIEKFLNGVQVVNQKTGTVEFKQYGRLQIAKMIEEQDAMRFAAMDDSWKVSNPETREIWEETTRGVDNGLSVFEISSGDKLVTKDGVTMYVKDEAQNKMVEESIDILKQNNLVPEQVTFINVTAPRLDNAGASDQKENRVGTSLRDELTKLAKLSEKDTSSDNPPVLIKINDNLYAVVNDELGTSSLTHMNIGAFLNNSFVLRYATDSSSAFNALLNVLRIVGSTEDEAIRKVIEDMPGEHALRNEWFSKTNDTGKTNKDIILPELEKLVLKLVDPAKGYTKGSEQFIKQGLAAINDSDYLENSKGILGQAYRSNLVMGEIKDLLTEFKAKSKHSEKEIQDLKTRFKNLNGKLNSLSEGNSINFEYLKASGIIDKNIEKTLVLFGEALGEYSASQRNKLLAEGLSNKIIKTNPDAPADIIRFVAERFVTDLINFDERLGEANPKQILINQVNKNKVLSSSAKKSINLLTNEYANDIVYANEKQLQDFLSKETTITSETDRKEIANIVFETRKKIVETILGKDIVRNDKYLNDIEVLFNELVKVPGNFKSSSFVKDEDRIDLPKDKTFTFEEKEKIVFSNLNLESIRNKLYDINTAVEEAIEFNTKLYEGAEEIESKTITINLNKLRGKTLNKITEAATQPHKKKQISDYEGPLFTNKLLAILYNLDGDKDNGNAVAEKIREELKANTSLRLVANDNVLLQFNLEDDGSIPAGVIRIFESLGYSPKDLNVSSMYNIPGVTLGGTVLRDLLNFESESSLLLLKNKVIAEYKNYNKKLKNANPETRKNSINNFYGQLEDIIGDSVSEYEMVNDGTIITDPDKILISNIDPTSLNNALLRISNDIKSYNSPFKVAIKAGNSDQVYNLARRALSFVTGQPNIETSKIYFINKILEVGFRVLKDKVDPDIIKMSIENKDFLLSTGIYNITKAPGEDNYSITVKGTPEDYLKNVSNYIKNNIGNVNLNAIANVYSFGSKVITGTPENTFLQKLNSEMQLEEIDKKYLLDLMKGNTNFTGYTFDLDVTTKKEIQDFIKGKSVLEIKTIKSKYDNNPYYILLKNNILGAEVLSKSIRDLGLQQGLTEKQLFIMGNWKARRALALAVRDYNQSLMNNESNEQALQKATRTFNEQFKNDIRKLEKSTEIIKGYSDFDNYKSVFNASNFRPAIENAKDIYDGIMPEDIKSIVDKFGLTYDDTKDIVDNNNLSLDYLKQNPFAEILEAMMIGSQDLEDKGFLVGLGSNQLLNMSDEAFSELENIILSVAPASKASLAKALFEKYNAIRSVSKSRDIVVKQLPTESEKQVGTASDNKVQITGDKEVDRMNMQNILENYAKSNKKKDSLKLSEVISNSENSKLNRLFGEAIAQTYNEAVNNPGSRQIYDFRNKQTLGKVLFETGRVAATLIQAIKGVDVNDSELFKDKKTYQNFTDTALKLFYYSTGLDFSNQYAKYVIVDSNGNIKNTANTGGRGFADVKELVTLLNDLKVTEESLAKEKLYVIEVNKNLINAASGISSFNPIKIMPLNPQSIKDYTTYIIREAVDEFDRVATVKDKELVRELSNEEDRLEQTIRIMYNRNISVGEINKLKKNIQVELMRTTNPNLSDEDAIELYNKTFFSLKNYDSAGADDNLTEEAFKNSVESSDMDEATKNYYIKNINNLFKYGFTYETIPGELQNRLQTNKELVNLDIQNEILKTFDILNTNKPIAKLNKIIAQFNSIKLAYENNDIDNARKQISILKQELKTIGLEETGERKNYYINFINYLSNYIMVNSENPKHIIARLLRRPYEDLLKSRNVEDNIVLKQSNMEDINGEVKEVVTNVNNAFAKPIYAADVENIYFNSKYKKNNIDTPVIFKTSIVEFGASDLKTKDAAAKYIKAIETYLENPTEENKKIMLSSVNGRIKNIVLPIYVFDGTNYKLLNSVELLKEYTEDENNKANDFYNKYYNKEKGIQKSFREYLTKVRQLFVTNKIQPEYKTLDEVKKALNGVLVEEVKDLNLLNDSHVLGYKITGDSDVEKLSKYKDLSNAKNNISLLSAEGKWIDVLSLVKDINTGNYQLIKNLDAVAGIKNTDAHDSEVDALKTLFVYSRILKDKINNLNYKSDFKTELENMYKEFFVNPENSNIKPTLYNFKSFAANSDAELKELFGDKYIESETFIKNIQGTMLKSNDPNRVKQEKLLAEYKKLENYAFNQNARLSSLREKDNYLKYKVDIDDSARNILNYVQRTEYIKIADFLNFMVKEYLYPNLSMTEFYNQYTNDLKNTGTKNLLFKDLQTIFNLFKLPTKQLINELDSLNEETADVLSKRFEFKAIETLDLTEELAERYNSIQQKIQNDFRIQDETKELRNAETFAKLLAKYSETTDYENIRKNQIRSNTAYLIDKFNNEIEKGIGLDFINDKKIREDLENELRDYYLVNDEFLENNNKIASRIYETFISGQDVYDDFAKNPDKGFVLGLKGIYTQAADMNIGQEIEIVVGADENGRPLYKTIRARGDTLYISEDIFRKHFALQKNVKLGTAFLAMKNFVQAGNDEPLYVMSTRHPNILGENQQIIPVQIIKSNKQQVVAINKDIARSKYRMDFDGDNIVMYAPDRFHQAYGEKFNKYTNFVYDIFTDMMQGVKQDTLKQSKYISIKENLFRQLNNVFNDKRLENDFTEIESSSEKNKTYADLKTKAILDIEKVYNSLNFDNKDKVLYKEEAIKRALDSLWYKFEDVSFVNKTKQDTLLYTFNPNITGKTISNPIKKKIRENLERINSSKFLTLNSRMFGDIAAGEYRNQMNKSIMNVQTNGNLNEIFNFQNFDLTDQTRDAMISNDREFLEAFNKTLKNKANKIITIIGQEVYDGILNRNETALTQPNRKAEDAIQNLIYDYQLLNFAVNANVNFKNDYAEFILDFKNKTKDLTEDQNNKLYHYLRSKLTDKEIEELGMNDIVNYYDNIGLVKETYERIKLRSQNIFRESFPEYSNASVQNLIKQIVYNNDPVRREIGRDKEDFSDYKMAKGLVFIENKKANTINEDQFLITKKGNKTFTYAALYKEMFSDNLISDDLDKLINVPLKKALKVQGKIIPANSTIGKIDYENRIIYYFQSYKPSGATKIIVPNSNFKGTNSTIELNEKNTDTLISGLPAAIQNQIDFITNAKNVDKKFFGTYVSPLIKRTYYDKNNNVITNKDKAVYYILEAPMKNSQYQESWDKTSKDQKVAELTINTSRNSLPGIFITGANAISVKDISDDVETKYEIKIDNTLSALLNDVEQELSNGVYKSANAKTKHDLMRLSFIHKLNKSNAENKMSDREFKELYLNLNNEPENANSVLAATINKYFGSYKNFVDTMLKNKKANAIGIALFSQEINDLFKNAKSRVVVGDESQPTFGKGSNAEKRLLSLYDNELGSIEKQQIGPYTSIGTSARQKQNKNITVRSTDYYPMYDYMVALTNAAKDYDEEISYISRDVVKQGTELGLLSRKYGYNGSVATDFKPIEINHAAESTERYSIQDTKAAYAKSQVELVKPSKPNLYDLRIALDGNKDNLSSKWATQANKNVDTEEFSEIQNRKALVWAISRGGSYKDILERYYAAGYADDEVKFNQTQKIIRSNQNNPVLLDIQNSSEILPLREWSNKINKTFAIDNRYDIIAGRKEMNLDSLVNIYRNNSKILAKEINADLIPDIVIKDPREVGLSKEEQKLYNARIDEIFNKVIADKKVEEPEVELNEYNVKFNMYNGTYSETANMDIKFKKDLLASAGISENTEEGFKLNNSLVELQKDKLYNETELRQELHTLFDAAQQLGIVDRINKYAFIKSMYTRMIDIRNRIEQLNNTLRIKDDAKIKSEIIKLENSMKNTIEKLNLGNTDEESIEVAERFLGETEKYYEPIISRTNKVIDYLNNEQKNILRLNGAPIDNIYFLLTPSVPAGTDQDAVAYMRKHMFDRNLDINNENRYTFSTYNFFNTMSEVASVIAKEKAYYNASRRFVEQGLMGNETLVTTAQNLIDKFFDEVYSKEEIGSKKIQGTQESIKKMIDDIKSNVRLDSYFKDTRIFEIQRSMTNAQWMINVYKELDSYLKFKGMSYEEAVAATKVETNESRKAEYIRISNAFENKNDLLAAIVKTFNVDLEPIYNQIKVIADQKGYAVTDRFGRIIPENPANYKTLSPLNFEYVLKGLQYYSPYNGGFKNNIVLDILNGDIFFMNKSLAEHLDKNEFRTKVPSLFWRSMQRFNGITTQLLMSNAFQLISRIGKWTMGDIGFGMITDWKHVLKLPDAYKELRAWASSSGKAMSEDLKDWSKFYPLTQDSANFNLILNNLDVAEKKGSIFDNAWTKTSAKVANFQSMFVRYAMFKAIKESFEKGKGNYGSVYFRKNMIDELQDLKDRNGNVIQTASGRKAGYVVAQTLGGALDFPSLSKKINGLFVFHTYPLALVRWARNEFSTIGTATKDLFLDSAGDKEAAFRNLYTKGLGIAGIYLALGLIYEAIAAIYNVDKEEKDEWSEEQATPEFIKTLFQGSPVMDKFNSINPFRQIQEKTFVPFQEGFEEGSGFVDGLSKGTFKFLLENFGNVSPAFKTTYEVLTGNDIIERSVYPAPEYNDTFDNFYRKVAGYFIGGAGSRELFRYKNDIAPYQTDMSMLNKVLEGATRVVDAEFGNTKAYKGEQKNYYKAKQIINSYRFTDETVETITKPNIPLTVYDVLRKEFSQAMAEEASQNKIYDIILAYAQEGVDLKTIRSALRSNSLDNSLSKLPNSEQTLEAMSEKEIQIIERALKFEETMYPWLNIYDDYLTGIINREDQQYKQNYYPNYYNRNYFAPNRSSNIRAPYLNFYRNKVYLKDPFKAYQAGYFELNPDKKRQMEE